PAARMAAGRGARTRVMRRAHRRGLGAGALLLPLLAHGAAYLPGADGAEAASPAQPPARSSEPAGNGLRWTLAPMRTSGTVALDLRWLRLEDGSRTSQALVYNDIDIATHLWQPWFAQLRVGVGVLAERDGRSAPGLGETRSSSGSLTGRVALAVFPASRFPFELRADVSDSRVSGDSLGADYRSQRLGITQSWRPELGNGNLMFNFEHSRLSGIVGVDRVDFVQANAFRQAGTHSLEFNASLTRNTREDAPASAAAGTTPGSAAGLVSSLGALGLRHGWRPDASTNVDTMATWNSLELGRRTPAGGVGADLDDGGLRSDLRQLSSVATWRPGATSLFQPESPLLVSTSLRWADSGVSSTAGQDGSATPLLRVSQRVRSVFGALGASQELGRSWRVNGSFASGLVQAAGGMGRITRNLTAALGWAPAPLLLGGEWRYAPSATLSAAAGDVRRRDQSGSPAGTSDPTGLPSGDISTQEPGQRRTAGLQIEHGASRSLLLDDRRGSLSFSLSQSLGALRASPSRENARALAHSASVYWQSDPAAGDGSRLSYAGLSVSDARAWAPEVARFQLVNLQFSQRQQLARHASWSGDLTVQASRNDISQIDAFSGELRLASQGWQRYTNGTLSYEDQRFLDVPRLRYTAILGLHSQQFESRTFGDIDAPRERITQSIEHRLDYAIGKLETRLAARYARVDGRDITALQARVLRRY
ncbi:MAG: hypothetical protein RLZZ584_4330, partial [Pseudomonadota bacterium]